MVAEVEQNCAAHTIFASIRHLYRLVISPLTLRDLSKYWPAFLQSGGKNAAGGDYSSAETSAQTIATTVKLAKKQGKRPLSCVTKPGFTSIAF